MTKKHEKLPSRQKVEELNKQRMQLLPQGISPKFSDWLHNSDQPMERLLTNSPVALCKRCDHWCTTVSVHWPH